MAIELCDQRRSVVEETGAVLVTGGPGSGKTTVALEKSRRVIDSGLHTGEKVLFLSFSRSAVARAIEASESQLPKQIRSSLSMQTFHSFFWEILKGYGYLLGAPRTLRLLQPQDESARRHQFESEGGAWEVERERIFQVEGLVAFDLFSEKTHDLLVRSARIRCLFASRYPMIVVDEAQDTAEDQWQCVRLLSEYTQLICLADLEQQIYDFRPGVSADRISHIMEELNPLRVDLEGQNHRSPNSEILDFANDILLNSPRGSAYKGVSRHMFRPNADRRDSAIRSAIGIAVRRAKDSAGLDEVESIAVLATWGKGVNILTKALTGNGTTPRIPHKVVVDEASVLLSSRLVAFLLEPRLPVSNELEDLAQALEMAAAVYQARGKVTNLTQAGRLSAAADTCRDGRDPRRRSVAEKLLHIIRTLRQHSFSGDPKRDWITVRRMLGDSGTDALRNIAKDAEQLVAFQRGRHIATNLTDIWQTQGSYANARKALDNAVAEDQLLSGGSDLQGIHVMTVHKSKGKEFDVVIIFDESNSSPLIFSREEPPYTRSRRLLRVGITRAKHHVLMLTDMYNPSAILAGHQL